MKLINWLGVAAIILGMVVVASGGVAVGLLGAAAGVLVAALDWHVAATSDPWRPGTRVCIVEMRGCMAEVRYNARYGDVEATFVRTPYGSIHPLRYVRVRMDDGTEEERPAQGWCRHDGLLEYQE